MRMVFIKPSCRCTWFKLRLSAGGFSYDKKPPVIKNIKTKSPSATRRRVFSLTEIKFFAKIVFEDDYMEKFNPNYSLAEFKSSNYSITRTAIRTAQELGFYESDIRQIISTMELKHFYKSMTSYANHKIWQDVYHLRRNDYGNKNPPRNRRNIN